mmetsp:Transcript_9547/g.17416  ORF Transcript_9547/g.17416 Transcript_9547/m.17416 type:complete len:354 (-) Transcript_9547:73-1134(-)
MAGHSLSQSCLLLLSLACIMLASATMLENDGKHSSKSKSAKLHRINKVPHKTLDHVLLKTKLNDAEDDEIAKLWHGSDDVDFSAFAGDVFASAAPEIEMRKRLQGRTIAVFGAFDSGTNLFCSMMSANFGTVCNHRDGPGGVQRDPHFFWKHTPPKNAYGGAARLEAFLQRITNADIHGFAIIRSPLSHIKSWTQASYDLRCALHRTDHCEISHQTQFTHEWRQWTFDTPGYAGVWNDYMMGYQTLSQTYDHMHVIRYEDLVLNPEQVIATIAEKLHTPVPSNINIIATPAKNHGHVNGRAAAIAKINSRSYLNELSSSDRARICGALQYNLGEAFSHIEGGTFSGKYENDCV